MLRIIIISFLLLSTLVSKELEKVSIQLQWLDQFQFAGYYIAKEKGFYKDAGLDVEIKKYQHGINVVDEVLAKRATFGVGRSSLLVERSRGKKVKILNAIFQSSPLILLARKDSLIQTIKDFRNKRIMKTSDLVENISLRAMMNKYGVHFNDMIPQKHSYNFEDIINRKTDLMASYISNEPYRLKQMGVEYKIFDPKDYGFETYGDILFTSEDEIQENFSRVKIFIEASLKGWRYAFDNIEEAVEILHKKYNGHNKTKDAMEFEAKELKKLAFYQTDEIGHIEKNKIQRIYDMYNVLGLIEEDYEIDEVFYYYHKYRGLDLTVQEQKYLEENQVLSVHNETNWAPFNFNENDEAQGFSIDYMKLLAKKLDIDIEFISGYTWSQYMKMLQSDELDLIINIVKTKQRAKDITFTEPYYTTQNVIYVNKSNPSFENITDLEYQKIAIPKDFFTQQYLEKNYPKIEQTFVKDQLEAFKLLSLGKVDAVIAKKVIGDYIIAHNNIASVTATKFVEDEGLISDLRIGASKDDQILIDILSKVQKRVSQEEINQLVKKWFGVKSKENITLNKKQKEYLQNKETIKMCINNSWTPIEFLANDTPQGISIDMLKMMEKKLGLSFEYVKTKSWSQSQEFLKQRKCDILPSAVKTDKRLEYANFTKSYITYDLAIITTNDKPLVAGVASIVDKKMVRNKGSGLVPKLQKNYPDLNIELTSSYKESLLEVSKRNAYFTIETLPVYNYYKNLYNLNNLHISGYTKMKYDLRIAVRNDDLMLLSIMNQALNVITEDTLDVIYEKWINQGLIKETDYLLIIYIVSIFGVLFFIVLFFMMRQKKLKETIEEQKEAFETLYQKSSDGILLIKDEKFIDCNESIVKMLGYKTKDEFLNIHPSELSPKVQPDGSSSLEKADEMMKFALENGTKSFEWVHRKANGDEFWADVVLTKINISGKDILHVVWRDIDSRKRAEKQLEDMNLTLQEKVAQEVESNREKDKQMLAQSRLAQMGEMISMIAHQWRQPLAAISSTTINLKFKLELKAYNLKDEKEQKECENFFIKELGDIERYVQNLTTTIEDFRNFYRPNRPREKGSIQEPIGKAINILKGSYKANNIEYIENYNDTEQVTMYESELMQVFLNIMKNAQDILKEKKTGKRVVTIQSENILNGVKVIICDTGGGIPSDLIANIFDPYFSTKLEKNGTGLGLYMSKIIVEEHHHGSIKAYNLDEGACFEITIKDNGIPKQ